jgi:hypothetical protein
MMAKLGMFDDTALIRYAISHRLIGITPPRSE